MNLTKRGLLLALVALGAMPAAATACPTPEAFATGREVGEAWRAANPNANLVALRAQLLPNGFCEAAIAALHTRVQRNFIEGDVFLCRGWRLSQTEAQLFALLSASP